MKSSALPPNLPVPEDDGGCSHLFKKRIPDISLQNQDGIYLKLRRNDSFRIVFYCYPMTGNPKKTLPENWEHEADFNLAMENVYNDRKPKN